MSNLPAAEPTAATGTAIERVGGGQVITVFSTKGGAGRSMLATNLGVLLVQRSSDPVVLVDADLQFGDIAVMLKLAPRHTVVDAVTTEDALGVDHLESLLATHRPSGLKVLAAPFEPAFADQVGADQMDQVVRLLRSFCSFVVVDTPAYLDDVVLTLVEGSDHVLLVADLDIPTVKNARVGLETLRLLNIARSKIHLVVNRTRTRVRLDVSDVEDTLQMKAAVLIPNDLAVPRSINRSTPVVLDAPRSAIARSIEQLANRFTPPTSFQRHSRWTH
jgi:pilus assembly protein CpaE